MRVRSSSAAQGFSGGAGGASGLNTLIQMPDKSGLPSRVRGVGPFGTASRVRNSVSSRMGSSANVPRFAPQGKRISNFRDSPGRTAIPDCEKDPYWQQGMLTEMSYVPGVKVRLNAPCDELVARPTAADAEFFALITASVTRPPSGSVTMP